MMKPKYIIYNVVLFLLVLVSMVDLTIAIPFVQLGNLDQTVTIRVLNVTDDTNETIRFNTLVGNCSANQQMFGVASNGARVCVTDSGAVNASANETIRFDNLVGFNCSGTDKYSGIHTNGTMICTTDNTSAGGGGGVTPHILNGTNHTGNLSTERVVKDTGTNWLSRLLDFILDDLWNRDVSINNTVNNNTANIVTV